MLTDPHSLPRARVNTPLANFAPFSEAFHCEAGSEMNPEAKVLPRPDARSCVRYSTSPHSTLAPQVSVFRRGIGGPPVRRFGVAHPWRQASLEL